MPRDRVRCARGAPDGQLRVAHAEFLADHLRSCFEPTLFAWSSSADAACPCRCAILDSREHCQLRTSNAALAAGEGTTAAQEGMNSRDRQSRTGTPLARSCRPDDHSCVRSRRGDRCGCCAEHRSQFLLDSERQPSVIEWVHIFFDTYVGALVLDELASPDPQRHICRPGERYPRRGTECPDHGELLRAVVKGLPGPDAVPAGSWLVERDRELVQVQAEHRLPAAERDHPYRARWSHRGRRRESAASSQRR